jgi:hypothetical protein
MSGKWVQRLTLGVACAALFAAVGGPSYAVTATTAALKKNSVSSKAIKSNAITSSKVKNGSLLAQDFKSGQLPKGDKGEKGNTGDAGSTVGYAAVNADGTVDSSRSKNITSAMVFKSGTGVYCLHDLPAGTKVAMVTPNGFGPDLNNVASLTIDTSLGGCAGINNEVMRVETTDDFTTTLADNPFFIWFED